MTVTDKAIRKYLGHNGGECRVRITRQGVVYRHGARDPFDRSHDYWTVIGIRDDFVREITNATAKTEK